MLSMKYTEYSRYSLLSSGENKHEYTKLFIFLKLVLEMRCLIRFSVIEKGYICYSSIN
jgi:hypothetical protein